MKKWVTYIDEGWQVKKSGQLGARGGVNMSYILCVNAVM
jgi:hypothetical protein